MNSGDRTLNETIDRLAWQIEQPNSYPLELFYPLIKAIGKRLYGADYEPSMPLKAPLPPKEI